MSELSSLQHYWAEHLSNSCPFLQSHAPFYTNFTHKMGYYMDDHDEFDTRLLLKFNGQTKAITK